MSKSNQQQQHYPQTDNVQFDIEQKWQLDMLEEKYSLDEAPK